MSSRELGQILCGLGFSEQEGRLEKLNLKRGQIEPGIAPCAKRFGTFSKSQWGPLKILSRSENESHSIVVRSYSDCNVEMTGGRFGGQGSLRRLLQ